MSGNNSYVLILSDFLYSLYLVEGVAVWAREGGFCFFRYLLFFVQNVKVSLMRVGEGGGVTLIQGHSFN